MRYSRGLLAVTVLMPLIAGLYGCASSMIEVRAGSDRVSLADANQVGSCQSKGEVIVSVLAKVGVFMTRSAEDVEANLLQLARNNAVDAGADTLVKGDSQEFGKRAFKMYKCRP